MNGLLATLRFELSSRRELLLLAGAVILIALLMPLVPGLAGYGVTEVVKITSAVLSLLLALLLALFVGAGLFGRDLAEDRLGFLFARPISGLAIWGGRLAAAVLAILACQLVAALPAVVVGLLAPTEAGRLDYLGVAVALYLLAPVVLLLLAHALGIVVRARTPFMALDLAGAMVVASLVWMALRPLTVVSAERALLTVGGGLAAGAVLALLVASALQVTIGRTSLARAHRWLSLPLWLGLTVVAAAGVGWSRWITSPSLEDLAGIDVSAVGGGGWTELLGVGHYGLQARFLYDLESGRHLRLPPSGMSIPGTCKVSGDGRRAVWLAPDERNRGVTITVVDLAGDLVPVATPLSFDRVVRALAVSDDGGRVAAVEDDVLAVYDVADGRVVGSARLGNYRWVEAAFLDPERVLIVQRSERAGLRAGLATPVGVLDVASGAVDEVASVGQLTGRVAVNVSPDRTRLAVIHIDGEQRSFELRSLPGDELLWSATGKAGFSSRFLADGSLVVASREGGVARLRLVTSRGEVTAEHELGAASWVRVGGQLATGEVLVTVHRALAAGDDDTWRQGSTEAIEPVSGAHRVVAADAVPFAIWAGWPEHPIQLGPSPAHRLLRRGDGALLLLDAAGVAMRELFPGIDWDKVAR